MLKINASQRFVDCIVPQSKATCR